MTTATETAAMAAVARLLGQLLVRELDAALLAELRSEELNSALAAIGIDVPAPHEGELEELGAEYWSHFLNPEQGGPPIQSLWVDGTYEAASAIAVRGLARAAALDKNASATRGAPDDHLGSILFLWAEASERAPAVADRIARDHLTWGTRALSKTASRQGFYGDIARAACAWIGEATRSIARA